MDKLHIVNLGNGGWGWVQKCFHKLEKFCSHLKEERVFQIHPQHHPQYAIQCQRISFKIHFYWYQARITAVLWTWDQNHFAFQHLQIRKHLKSSLEMCLLGCLWDPFTTSRQASILQIESDCRKTCLALQKRRCSGTCSCLQETYWPTCLRISRTY